MFFVGLFLFLSLIFSRMLNQVQTLNPFGKNVPNLRFWVSFLLKDTRCFEKAKDCLFEWFLSFFKFCFRINFSLFFLHQFRKYFFCANWYSFRRFGVSFSAKRSSELEIAEIFSFASYFIVFEFDFWTYQCFSPNNLSVNLLFRNVTTKLFLGLVPCIGSQVYCSILRLCVELFSPEIFQQSPKLASLFLRWRCKPTKSHSQQVDCKTFYHVVPSNPCNRKPIGQNCQIQILALVFLID